MLANPGSVSEPPWCSSEMSPCRQVSRCKRAIGFWCLIVDGSGKPQLILSQPGLGDPIPCFSCFNYAALFVEEEWLLPESGVSLCCRILLPLVSTASLVVNLQEVLHEPRRTALRASAYESVVRGVCIERQNCLLRTDL